MTETLVEERKEIVELFPNLDLSEVFAEYSHLSTEALVLLILDKGNLIPSKKIQHGFCHRLITKTYTGTLAIAHNVSKQLPSWMGGKLLGNVVNALGYQADGNDNRVHSITEALECCVCWEAAPVADMCFCDPLATKSENASKETHNFCRACLVQHANAASEEMPLAKGGLGLPCMMHGCGNPITFREISVFVSPDMISKLEERAAELSITQAELRHMERCLKCNCAVELGQSAKQMQVFVCPECKYEFCRLCEEKWLPEHKGISCEEYMVRNCQERLLEKRLSEAVVRQCPKCKMAFVKNEGCNKITCKCGHTQCYICRTDSIDYTHFCSCPHAKKRRPDGTYQCEKCGKKCLLFESPGLVEQRHMERIRAEVAEHEAKKAAKGKGRLAKPTGAKGKK